MSYAGESSNSSGWGTELPLTIGAGAPPGERSGWITAEREAPQRAHVSLPFTFCSPHPGHFIPYPGPLDPGPAPIGSLIGWRRARQL